MSLSKQKNLLNGLCPYFTMFPLEFPYSILHSKAMTEEWVLDPFCGRGTTNYACRILGLPSIGIDNSPVATAISEAKLAATSPKSIILAAERMLESVQEAKEVPDGEFWEWAFHQDVLPILCRFREGLLKDCNSQVRKALRGILLGALHGPRPKGKASYFSNQSQRTYAPKPRYAVNYWKARNLKPEPVDILEIIKTRAERYYQEEKLKPTGYIVQGDSRLENAYLAIQNPIRWVITSPPYYGMNTYIPDQWLRMWFLGGSPDVTYSLEGQLKHPSPDEFAKQLRAVWVNVGRKCLVGAKLIIRFGGINSRKAEPLDILKQSLHETGWAIDEIKSAGVASEGKRQALHIKKKVKDARKEYDVWSTWQGSQS